MQTLFAKHDLFSVHVLVAAQGFCKIPTCTFGARTETKTRDLPGTLCVHDVWIAELY